MKKKVVIPAIFLIFTVFAGYIYSGFQYATDNTVTASLKKYPQNALAYHIRYRDANLSLEKKLKRKFLDHYFSPWKGKLPDKANLDKESLSDIKQDFKDQFQKLSANPGMGANMHTYNKEWVKSLKANADFQNFPRLNANAIPIKPPTEDIPSPNIPTLKGHSTYQFFNSSGHLCYVFINDKNLEKNNLYSEVAYILAKNKENMGFANKNIVYVGGNSNYGGATYKIKLWGDKSNMRLLMFASDNNSNNNNDTNSEKVHSYICKLMPKHRKG